jgi:ribosomal protein S18 acetylase RimI-like enzyme
MDLKGKYIKEIIETTFTGSHAIIQVSGLKIKYDLSKPDKEKIVEILINNKPLEDEKTYRVSTPDFLATGGDGYESFKKAKNLDAKQVILYSNTLNAGAIKLYEKVGFRHIPVEPGTYKRANVKMVIDIETAIRAAKRYDWQMQNNGVKVIRADVTNAAIVATIGKKAFRHAFENLFKSREELTEYLEFTYDPVKLTRSIRKENNVYLLAFLDGKAVGFAKLKKHSLNDLIESPVQMELQKIYVLSEYQGRSVGTALMQEVKNIAIDGKPDCIWLDTYISNDKAIQFYAKNGYRKIGNYFFTIGSQTFEYFVMELPIAGTVSVYNGKDFLSQAS